MKSSLKRYMPFLFIVALVGFALVMRQTKFYSAKDKVPVSSRELISEYEAQPSKNLEKTESVETKVTPKLPEQSPNYDAALDSVPSFEEIERDFARHTRAEVEIALSESQQRLEQSGLIQKANKGVLSEQEVQFLAFEMRLQAVLSQKIIQAKLAEISRRYL